MAERRMFARKIVSTDAFLDMPTSARCLYFALGMEADDDGFVGNPKSVMRQVGLKQSDLKMLADKRYILTFPSGVIVIKHWRLHNLIRSDRHEPTTYVEEMDTLTLDAKEGYVEKEVKNASAPKCQPNDNQVSTECPHRLGKISIGEDSLLKILKNKESIAEVCARVRDNETFATACDEVLSALAFAGESERDWTFGERTVSSDEFARLATKPHGFDGNMLCEAVNALILQKSESIVDRRFYILGIIVNRFMR